MQRRPSALNKDRDLPSKGTAPVGSPGQGVGSDLRHLSRSGQLVVAAMASCDHAQLQHLRRARHQYQQRAQ